MLKWIFRGLIVGFLTLAGGGLMALLGRGSWWLALALAVALYVIGGWALKTFARRAILGPFKLKGQVLQGAKLRVHRIETAAPPPPDLDDDEDEDDDPEPTVEEDEDEDEAFQTSYYHLDVTITPTATDTKMSLWEPAELLVVPFDSVDDPEAIASDGGTGYVEGVQLLDGSNWIEDEAGKYAGEQRLKLLVAAPDDLRTAKFRYYFESFGRFELPRR